MTLAPILLGLCLTFSGSPAQADAATSSASQQNQNAPSPQAQEQASPSASPQPPAKPTPAAKAKAAKPHKPKKKAADPDCTAAGAGGAATPAAAPAKSDPASSSAATGAGHAPCPPKIVVHDGGSDEPAIKLTGGEPGTGTQRTTADQLLAATEDNLKKIEGRQLSAGQQDVVTQIHQYMQQSKAAVTAGDMERGRNLALKAHLLSDELLKP